MLSKNNKSKLLVISIATALSVVSSQIALSADSDVAGLQSGGDAFLYGESIQVGINKNGAFGSEETKSKKKPYDADSKLLGFIADPSNTSFGGDFDGDFFMPGVAEAGWGVFYKNKVYHNTRNRFNYQHAAVKPIETTPISGSLKEYRKIESGQEIEIGVITWSGDIDDELLIRQDYGIYVNGLSITVNIELKNNTSAVMKDVYYMSTLDPDNNFQSSSVQNLSTVNTIHSQGNNSGVAIISAKQTRDGNDRGESVLKLIGYGGNVRVARGGKFVRSPVAIYDAPNGLLNDADDNNSEADESVSIAFKYEEIKPGETVRLKLIMQLSDLNSPTLTLDKNDSTHAGMVNGYKTIYTSGGEGVSIADIVESDSEITAQSADLKGLEVNLATVYPNDVLELIQSSALPQGIKLVEDPSNQSLTKLTFMGGASIADYKKVLESIVFKNTGVSPSLDERRVDVSVIDRDYTFSNMAQAFIGVIEPVRIGVSITTDNIVNNKEEIDKVEPSGTATPGLPIKLIFTDKKSGSTPIEVIVPVAKNINGVWSSAPVDISALEDGEITLVAMTEDAKGYKSSDEKKFTKNTAIEDITISSPAKDEVTKSIAPTITGTADPKSDVVMVINNDNKCEVKAGDDGKWECAVSKLVLDSAYTIDATSTNEVGSEVKTSSPFKTAPLTLEVTAPKDKSTVGAANFLVAGTSLPEANITVKSGDKNCTTKADENGDWGCEIKDLPTGSNKLTVEAVGADNIAKKSEELEVTVPKIPLIVTSPAQDELIESNKVSVTGTTDPKAKVTVSTGVDGEACTTIADVKGDWSCSFDVKEASEDKTLNITSKLADDGEKNSTVKIKLPSILGLDVPENNDTVANDSPLVVGKSLSNADIEVIGENGKKCTTKADENGNWSCAIQGLLSGAQKLDIKVKTPSGLEAMETINITVPNTPLLVTYPPEDELITTDKVKTVGTTDPGAKITVSTGVEGETCTATANSEGKWECSFDVVTYTPTKLLSIKSELDGETKIGNKGLRLKVAGEKENESGVTTVLKGGGSTSPLGLLFMGLGLMVMRKLRKAK